jgi:hypothetical protein
VKFFSSISLNEKFAKVETSFKLDNFTLLLTVFGKADGRRRSLYFF